MLDANIPSPINSSRIYPDIDCIKETAPNIDSKVINKFHLNYFWVHYFYNLEISFSFWYNFLK